MTPDELRAAGWHPDPSGQREQNYLGGQARRRQDWRGGARPSRQVKIGGQPCGNGTV
jgi:hypothetical protein